MKRVLWFGLMLLLPGAALAQEKIAVSAEIVTRDGDGDQCRLSFSLRAEQGHVFFRRDLLLCDGTRVVEDEVWDSAPQNGKKRFSITCSTTFGDPMDRCTDGTVRPTSTDMEGVQKSTGTYSSVLRDGLIAFTEDGASSGTWKTLTGQGGSFSNEPWAQSVTVEISGKTCRVTSYTMHATGLTNKMAKQVKCSVRRS